MKQKLFISSVLVILTFLVFSCGKQDTPKTDNSTTKNDANTDKSKVTDTVKTKPVNVDEIVTKITALRTDIEAKLNNKSLTKKTVDIKSNKDVKESIKQKWEKVDAYYDGNNLVRIQTYPYANSERREEFYIKDGKLAFVFISDKGPNDEGKDTGDKGKEFYFDNDKLVKYVNNTGEKETNADAEKNMYETRLPYELSDWIDLLKNVK